ncbi:MAG: hypothetical protein ABSB40_12535 [Nitrososphaeria archaeon]|jgi:hypothetical protein
MLKKVIMLLGILLMGWASVSYCQNVGENAGIITYPPENTEMNIFVQLVAKACYTQLDTFLAALKKPKEAGYQITFTKFKRTNKYKRNLGGEDYSVIEYGSTLECFYPNDKPPFTRVISFTSFTVAYIQRGNSWYGSVIAGDVKDSTGSITNVYGRY